MFSSVYTHNHISQQWTLLNLQSWSIESEDKACLEFLLIKRKMVSKSTHFRLSQVWIQCRKQRPIFTIHKKDLTSKSFLLLEFHSLWASKLKSQNWFKQNLYIWLFLFFSSLYISVGPKKVGNRKTILRLMLWFLV